MTWKEEPGDDLTMTDCIRACERLLDAVVAYRAALEARDTAHGIRQTAAEREEELLDVVNSCLAQRWIT